MSNPEQAPAAAPAATPNWLEILESCVDCIRGVSAQVGQQISEKLIDHGPQYTVATRKLSPGDYKKLVEDAMLQLNTCAMCGLAEMKPLSALSCGHGCCKKCSEKRGPQTCRAPLCSQKVVVKEGICPRSKLLFDLKFKLDHQRARLALVTESEYAELLAKILVKLNTCIECGVFQKTQRLLANCGHVICQGCIVKHADFERVLCLNFLTKPHVALDCPTCKISSTVAAGGFLKHDRFTSRLYITYKEQQMYNADRVEHPLSKFETPMKVTCNLCKKSSPSQQPFYECKTCKLEDYACTDCIASHQAENHNVIPISQPEIRQNALKELQRLYHCADQYLLGILTAFEHDFHSKQTGTVVERIVADRDGIVNIYEGVAIAQIVIEGMAKQVIKKAEVHVKRLRMIMDVVTKDWPRLRSQAIRMVDDVLEIPSDDEYDKLEDTEDEEEAEPEPQVEVHAEPEPQAEDKAEPEVQPEAAQVEPSIEEVRRQIFGEEQRSDSDSDFEVV